MYGRRWSSMSPTPQQVSWSWGKYRQRLHNLKTVALVLGVCKRGGQRSLLVKVSQESLKFHHFIYTSDHSPVSAVYPWREIQTELGCSWPFQPCLCDPKHASTASRSLHDEIQTWPVNQSQLVSQEVIFVTSRDGDVCQINWMSVIFVTAQCIKWKLIAEWDTMFILKYA